MRHKIKITLTLICLLAATTEPLGQNRAAANNPPTPSTLAPAGELEGMIDEAGKLDDPLALVKIKSKAAGFLWRRDPGQSRAMFLELWDFIKTKEAKGFDKEEARSVLLKHLFPRDYALAVKLVGEAAGAGGGESASLQAQVTGSDPSLRRLAKISSELIDQDTALAAGVLQQSLSVSVTPAALSSLSRMRDKDPALANYVAAGTLERLKARPSIVALTGLHLLTSYVFPPNARAAAVESSDESLQYRYFSTAHEIFRASLGETRAQLLREGRYTENDLRFREVYQGQMASILAALSPRFGPQFSQELNELAAKMSAGMPPNIAQLSRTVASRLGAPGGTATPDKPEAAIPGAIMGGDFVEAERLIGKLDDEPLEKAFTQLLAKTQFRSHLGASELPAAMTAARKVDEPGARAFMYADVARAANKKGDAALCAVAINEARASLREVAVGGLRARALLLLAAESLTVSEPDSVEFLRRAVSEINTLAEAGKGAEGGRGAYEAALAEVNDPRSFVDAPEMQRALSQMGRANLSAALQAAYAIENNAVRLSARLAASESLFDQPSRRKKGTPAAHGPAKP